MTAAPPPPPGQPYAQPAKKRRTGRTILFVLLGLMAFGLVSCVALAAVFVNEVDEVVQESEAQDAAPGGPDNPLAITPGEAFSVAGFDYQPGWSVGADVFGLIEIRDLRVQNNRPDQDGAIVEVRFMRGQEVVGLSNCTTEQIPVGQITSLSCLSGDDFTDAYDTITIRDTF
ncbi:hypothetical protein HMPREF0063_10561 [Aeromicrobium marinum DSM 15272]|uniref:Uncharacterized protein n=1 Tax=Aeromicrobium marinum DSM 15272 TaxID=585531 RepID=E2S9C1_9ACTN|nr:hypothetical protein [Aeromicrobium marinum]EFQ83845.1 hypothetical protein HMPREF0063_10561 [Aeromicrobium marinum DSM 15272]